jgi:glycolate oxidase
MIEVPLNETAGAIASVSDLVLAFSHICGADHVSCEEGELHRYRKDETHFLSFDFDILVKPGSSEEIAKLVRLCNQCRVPVTPRGGGSGVTGGALPVKRGVVISMERLNRILSVSKADCIVVAESGVVTSDLCRTVEAEGLYFPVIPTSADSSFIGGNVAENAGSVNSCKYGTTAEYVLNLEVVLPSGDIIWTGANVRKNATGLNLTQLFVGSEGILGIITKVVYRLLPKPSCDIVLFASFNTLADACNAVKALKQSNVMPAVAELICDDAMKMSMQYDPACFQAINFREGQQAWLLLELDGMEPYHLEQEALLLESILQPYVSEPVLLGTSHQEKQKLRSVRYNVGAVLNNGHNHYRDLDVCLPVSALYDFLVKVKTTADKFGIQVVRFGHALDGNMHTMLLFNNYPENHAASIMQEALTEIYSFAIARKGVISGEHGIGLLQREFVHLQYSSVTLQLLKQLKQLMDPHSILNPGKVI